MFSKLVLVLGYVCFSVYEDPGCLEILDIFLSLLLDCLNTGIILWQVIQCLKIKCLVFFGRVFEICLLV